MSTDVRALNEQLKREWCDAFSVSQLPDGSFTVTTPFLSGDGDGYPVVIDRRQGGWQLSDRGIAISNLRFGELEITQGRLQQIDRFATEQGCSNEAGVLTMSLAQAPTIEDIADFIELLAQVSGLPRHVAAERDSERFGTRARDRVLSWLPQDDLERWAMRSWAPTSMPHGDLFPADLYLRAKDARPGVVAFFAGSTQKADRSLLSVSQYRHWGIDYVRPVLAHNGTLNSETIYRAQTTIADDSRVVEVNEVAAETGYLALQRKLQELGVPVV